MKQALEILTFAGLAAGLHLAAWSWMGDGGPPSAGSGGQAPVTLAAASGDISTLVAQWAEPPSLITEVAQSAPDTAAETSASPAPRQDSPPRRLPPEAPQAARAENLPTRPIAPAAPPPSGLEIPAQPARPKAIADLPPRLPMASRRPAPDDAAAPRLALATPETPPEIDTTRPDPRAAIRPNARPRALAAPSPAAAAKPATAAKPTQSATTTRQTAAGNKQGKTAGQKTETSATTLSTAQRQSLLSSWGGVIRTQVERRKRYPSGSAATGTAVVRLNVAPQGQLLGANLARSSGDARLDQAALYAVRRARIPAAPKGLGKARYSFDLPISFRK